MGLGGWGDRGGGGDRGGRGGRGGGRGFRGGGRRGEGGFRGGGGRGGRGGGGFRGGRGGGGFYNQGPPEEVKEFGTFEWVCQDELVVKSTLDDVPYFNAPMFLENKQQIGKVDEIFGTLREYYVSVKLNDDVKAASFNPKQKVFIDSQKLLPLKMFLPGNQQRGRGGRGRGGDRGRGGRGGSRGGGFGGRGGGGGRGGFRGGGGRGFGRGGGGGGFRGRGGGFRGGR